MNYIAVQGDALCAIEVTRVADAQYVVVIDGRRLHVDAQLGDDGRQSLLIDNQSFVAEVDARGHRVEVSVDGDRSVIEMLDLRQARLRQAQAAAAEDAGPVILAAPMPGRVVAVLVREGQQVEAGQGVVVVEAMKMENELRAPRAGTIVRLDATVGAAVESGVPLCEVG